MASNRTAASPRRLVHRLETSWDDAGQWETQADKLLPGVVTFSAQKAKPFVMNVVLREGLEPPTL